MGNLAALAIVAALVACNRGTPPSPPASETRAADTTQQQSAEEEPAVSQSEQSRIHELLAKHPATEKMSGVKHAKVSIENGKLVIEVSPSQRKQTDRYEAPLASLDLSQMGTSVTPEHNLGQVYIPCRNNEACAVWLIRDEGSSEWRQARTDSEIALDFAPDQAVADEIKSLLAAWLGAQR